ncbi:unnamed protein product [Periconia digitata]|uniref:Uncharacterized protein n=1 Tax=Periconia digitata TaxID=1303443 RepID=A0A9W4UH37_9PLEO|nr:unnamed protein product [Periconia digitata]
MDSRAVLRQILRAPHAYRTSFLTTPTRPQTRNFALLSPELQHQRYISAPRILQPSFWASMIPQPLKNRSSASPQRGWNPATPYIILALLVGSQAIQVIWLKQERGHYLRHADAKIGLLREIIERVQRGEKVDVETALGTGDAGEEAEWAQVLRNIEQEERLYTPKRARLAAKQSAAEQAAAAEAEAASAPKDKSDVDAAQGGNVKVEVVDGAKFY